MTTFTTNPVSLHTLLQRCEQGDIKLPDFQRNWVWDEYRIRSLIASLSQAFPVGALMTLKSSGKTFTPRAIQGAPVQAEVATESELLLDGQQRMTSLYQALVRQNPIEKIDVFYYFNIDKALDPSVDREDAIEAFPKDRILRTNFGKDVVLDLSTSDKEYEHLRFPLNKIFDHESWQEGFWDYWDDNKSKRLILKAFREKIVDSFRKYQVPVISLDKSTTNEAVCLVFEKVNTGGKALDAFELITAMFAGKGFKLREDWAKRAAALKKFRALEKIAPTDFLQGIALLHSKAQRDAAAGSDDRRPPVSATRNALLALPVEAYQTHADRLQLGFERAAKFLHTQRIYRSFDLPYQSQIVPLAAILASLGDRWEHQQPKQCVRTWYWCGVFGELYGSAAESRFAKDVVEVLAWIDGGPEPSTLKDTSVRASRIRELRSRGSAAYKGVNALLMKSGATDFRSGQDYDHAVFFDESVDIHHIFPRDWCQEQKLPASAFDSIVNKTPLSAKTNRMLGGVAPSKYLHRLEAAKPPVDPANLDTYLRSHAIDPARLRADDFHGFFAARLDGLLDLIDDATKRPALRDVPPPTDAVASGLDPQPPLDPDDEAEAFSENAALADDAALLSEVR
ncbi:DUF262 domain-containing protein [Methylobacterium sp. NMS14P]|uniref:GmrSD restriction endonuclease domain-containing protein n=1 Tax=Methylobacterium sp. NMS14P TaxID=2894310 RepID=UPI0023597AB0|nr:DUF262 domain-containing protein [Methylobacterium sp. NMS14P]WCS26729.1 DUF262 domain-containing protein [Methylobacterium sp. NMS14P]